MHPTLFHLGGVGIHSYGIAIAIGFITAILLGVRAGRRQGIGADRVLDLAFWILVSTILGARVLYIVTEAQSYYRACVGADAAAPRGAGQIFRDCTLALQLWEGGLVYYGGLCAATLATLWFCRRRGLDFLRVADLVAPLAAIGHFFGRVGCFCAGCCYGKRTSSALGLEFPPPSMIYKELAQAGLLDPGARATPPVVPTQLLEAAGELALFLALTLLAPRKRYHGQLTLCYLAAYAALRFVLELYRADPDRRFVVELATPALARALGLAPDQPLLLSTSQLISLLVGAAVAYLYLRLRRTRPRPA
jgi:phosphatidylglycerol:prolipoprotein diacylglycerol transferase